MTLYSISLTGVFEADSIAEALAEFRDWASMPGCVEDGAEVVEMDNDE